MTTAPSDGGFGLWEVAIATGMLCMNLGGALIGGTWALARSREKVNQKIDQIRFELEQRLGTATDLATSRFGETITAMRQKVSDMELWNRDNFVNKNTFTLVMQRMDERWDRFEDKLDKRDERFDKRLDSIEAKLNGGIGGK